MTQEMGTMACSEMGSADIGELAKALSAAQGEMGHAAKSRQNPHFRSSYADLASVLDACREPLAKHGLAVVQLALGDVLVTRLLHTSGQWLSATTPIVAKERSPQAYGSAVTYARRYALSALVGVAQADDDGEAAEGRHAGSRGADPRLARARESQPTASAEPYVARLRAAASDDERRAVIADAKRAGLAPEDRARVSAALREVRA